jgi:peptide/nickel transport system ATP-binding protein
MSTRLVEARRVGKRFGDGPPAVDDLSMAIDAARPAITAVVGESGSGKTTLARMLLGLTEPSSGDVLYLGRDMRRLTGAQRQEFRRDVQAVFQDPYEVYNPFYRVDHVLTTPVRKFRLAKSRAEGRALIGQALRDVGLQPEEILGRFPHQLSGGQRQRIMVARALLLRPRLIVADEPVSMVDASLRATILTALRKLNEELKIAIIYITHDLATAYQISDHILVMYRARVVEAGEAERIVRAPQHPYTRMLVAAVPRVSTTRDWLELDRPTATTEATDYRGCRFAPRCPVAMPECHDAPPPLFRTESERAVACLRYRQAPELAPEELQAVFGG